MSGRRGTGGHVAVPTHTPIGSLIAYYNLTRSYVAEESGVPRQWLWRYIEGFVPITPLHLARLCDYFDLEPDQLQTPEWVIEEVRALGKIPKTGVDVNINGSAR